MTVIKHNHTEAAGWIVLGSGCLDGIKDAIEGFTATRDQDIDGRSRRADQLVARSGVLP